QRPEHLPLTGRRPRPTRAVRLERADLLGAERREDLRSRRAAHHPGTHDPARQELHVPLMRLRDLPSVDELTRGLDDPLATPLARTLLDRAREQIRAGDDPGD